MDEARRLASEEKYEEALQKHIWFHDNILEEDRSYYGVRLSYALQEWIELGNQYPKALTALKEIREKKAERLLNGELVKSLFHDVESINDHLKEQERTVELFKKLSEASAEFAGEIYNLAGEALIGAKEYSLAKKFLGDPMAKFSTAKSNFNSGMEYAKTSPMGEMSRSAFEAIFTEKVVRLITLLDNTGDRKLALGIQKEALAVLNNPEIKNAINE